jgi:hypothetical protein
VAAGDGVRCVNTEVGTLGEGVDAKAKELDGPALLLLTFEQSTHVGGGVPGTGVFLAVTDDGEHHSGLVPSEHLVECRLTDGGPDGSTDGVIEGGAGVGLVVGDREGGHLAGRHLVNHHNLVVAAVELNEGHPHRRIDVGEFSRSTRSFAEFDSSGFDELIAGIPG